MKRKIILSILVLAVLVFIPSHRARADVWGANAMAAILKHTMERIDAEIHGAIMGALKIAAAESINSTVSSLISSGGTTGALYITDWRDELVLKPQERTMTRMEGYFQSRYRGRSSGSNYIAANQGEGISGNYYTYLEQVARNSVSDSDSEVIDVYSYCDDPSDPFAQGNWRCFSATAGLPFKEALSAQSKTISIYQEEQMLAEDPAIAYKGFKPQMSGSSVITPGSTIADMYSNAQDLGNKIIASAQSIPEVITAVVTRIATNAIRQGIGNAQRNVQREIYNVTSGVRRDVNEAVQQSGPGQLFKPMY